MAGEIDLRGGDLAAAIERVQQQVRSEPAVARHRIALFQLLAVGGEWERAMTQLNVLADLDVSTLALVHTYREALKCEALRAEIFSGKRAPVLFGDPEQWMALLTEALRLSAEGRFEESQALRREAFDAAPATSGRIDDREFEWIADGDSRLGPILETIVNGRYYWIPFHRIKEIRIDQPAESAKHDLRDFVWMPAHFAWTTGGESVGLIPTRYPDSERSDEVSIRLARKTEWIEKHPEIHFGLGQRMLATDAGEYPLLDIRRIELRT